MSGCENILRTNLVKSETLPIFVMRTGCRLTEYSQDIFSTADKAALLRRFYFGSLDRFAKLQERVALFCTSISQIFSRMRTGENLAAGTPGVPDATANARNSVESILRLSNEEIADTLSRLTHEQLIEVAPFFRVVFCLIECWQGDRSSNPEKSKAL